MVTLTPLDVGGLMVAGREILRCTHGGLKVLPTARLGGLVSRNECAVLGKEARGLG
jgi:hypothetical protein